MAMTRIALFLCVSVWVSGPAARAQSLTSELSTTIGGSSEEVAAIGAQARLFGELESEIRVYLEGAWATRSDVETDAFGAAYPYGGRLQLVEAYAERIVRRGPWVAGARLGRYRTPFGIYARGDHAYTGFLRAPLIRYDDYYGLSNHFLEGGVNILAGTPGINAEVSLGVPQDIGTAARQPGFDPVIHVQAYRGSLVVGFSHIRSKPYERRSFARGHMVFTGIDARWMQSGIQLRGEYIFGKPFDFVSTDGWYIDAIVHRPALGPLTFVARVEDLDYDAGRRSAFITRYTAGGRIQLTNAVAGHFNVLHQSVPLANGKRTGLDAGLTVTLRHGW
jgi:hypothetical protein